MPRNVRFRQDRPEVMRHGTRLGLLLFLLSLTTFGASAQEDRGNLFQRIFRPDADRSASEAIDSNATESGAQPDGTSATTTFTKADPLISQVRIGRDARQQTYATFVQIYEDGTVMDAGGVHKIDPRAMRPLVEALDRVWDSGIDDHCGTGSAGSLDVVHLIIYDRGLGRLRARTISHDGSMKGCRAELIELNRAILAFQALVQQTEAAANAAGTGRETTSSMEDASTTAATAEVPTSTPMTIDPAVPLPRVPEAVAPPSPSVANDDPVKRRRR